jgi:sortase A
LVAIFVWRAGHPPFFKEGVITVKKLGSVFIVIGVFLLLFIVFTKVKTFYEQKKLVEEYTSLSFTEQSSNESEKPIKEGQVIGILKIPKISLETPIKEGARPKDIKYAVGHLSYSSSIYNLGKKNQNFVIAGHRSHTYGKFFNRLDELKKGDHIIIYAQNKVFTYKVFNKKIVKPTEIDVVYPIKNKSMVTLVTCHPLYSNKQRLIVFTELEKEKIMDGRDKF